MAVSAYPENVTICCHGIRAIEWILEAGGTQVVRTILDEDVLKLCTDLVAIHNDGELLRFICGVAGKICRYSGRRSDAVIVRVPRASTECTGEESVRGEGGRSYEEVQNKRGGHVGFFPVLRRSLLRSFVFFVPLNHRGRSEGRDPVQRTRSDRGLCEHYGHS